MAQSSVAVKEVGSVHRKGAPRPMSDAVIAYGLMRVIMGINIALHGISRQIAGQAVFLAYLNHYFEKTPLIPKESLPIFAFTIMWAETIFGLLMLVGAFTRIALIGGSLVIAMLAVGSNLAQDWGIAGLQLTYALIYYFLLKNREELNKLSIDGLRK
jgi:thiosulfate dehydrogenase [quinone] large subunit